RAMEPRCSSRRAATWPPTVPMPSMPTPMAEVTPDIVNSMALLLREADVQRLVRMAEVVDALEAAMRELGGGTAQNEPRRRVFAPGSLLNVMFASLPSAGLTGLKAYTVGGGRVRFLVVLFGLD